MKAAVVARAGEAPAYAAFADPVAGPGEVAVEVVAAALSPLARARASGMHYSSAGGFPFVAGVDGVGRLDDGSIAYFLLPRAPFGAMAERTVVAANHVVAVPPGLNPVAAAAMANPGMSSWAALTLRARLEPGETVLINGATGASGQLAVQIARHLRAGRVVATGRDPAALALLPALGADVVIPLDNAAPARFRDAFAAGVDVVVDYLWGPSAEALLTAAAQAGPAAVPLRFVQVGTASGSDITLSGAILRSSAIELMGSGIGSVSLAGLVAAVGGVLAAAGPANLRLDATSVPLTEVGAAWARDDGRVVFTLP